MRCLFSILSTFVSSSKANYQYFKDHRSCMDALQLITEHFIFGSLVYRPDFMSPSCTALDLCASGRISSVLFTYTYCKFPALQCAQISLPSSLSLPCTAGQPIALHSVHTQQRASSPLLPLSLALQHRACSAV